MTESNYSLSDIAAVSGNRNNDGMFGGDWGAWIILFLIFGLFGNGRGFGGFGGGNGGSCGCSPCATQADVRAAVDQQTLISKLDQQTYGLADSTYTLNNTITSGFHGVDNAICNLGYNVQSGFNTLGHQISDCCCQTQRAIDGVNYNMAKGFCDLGNTMNINTRDILESNNANTRAILDFLTQDKISTLQEENQTLKLKASQAAQNQYLVNELRPCPIPAYVTCNPWASSYSYNGYGACGCGCN